MSGDSLCCNVLSLSVCATPEGLTGLENENVKKKKKEKNPRTNVCEVVCSKWMKHIVRELSIFSHTQAFY